MRARLAPALCAAAAALLGPAVLAAAEDARSRDRWQRPREVMDALGIGKSSRVADVGAGDGYFTLHLARRVGDQGRVYAVDILESELAGIRRTAERLKLRQVETVSGATDDPKLPPGTLDAILVVNSYHEMTAHDAMMAGFARALRPGGRLGIIDKVVASGEPRESYGGRHVIPSELVRADAVRHGLVFVGERPGFVRPRNGGEDWYFLVFARPPG